MANAKSGKKKLGKGRHASTIKRERQNKKRKAINRHNISTMRTAVKKVRVNLNAETLKEVLPLLAKCVQKGIIHKNKAARLKSRLTKAVNKAK